MALRPRIVKALLHKEWLRYRHNVGLLAVVVALLALSGLVSLSGRFKLGGVGGGAVTRGTVWHQPGSKLAERLKELSSDGSGGHVLPRAAWERHRRPEGIEDLGALEFREEVRPLPDGQVSWPRFNDESVPPGSVGLVLFEPPPVSGGPRRVVLYYREAEQAGTAPFRDWVTNEATFFYSSRPELLSYSRMADKDRPSEGPGANPLPFVVTALVVFGMYLCSFNIFVTSTGEEREKKIVLALMLTPASGVEYLASKAIFYAGSSLFVALAVAGMYKPSLLAVPWLWTTLALGSVGYVSIGTVALCLVRRQTTVNTLSMLYLIGTSIVMILSQAVPLFLYVRMALVENLLYSQIQAIVSGSDDPWQAFAINQMVLAGMVGLWALAAVWAFDRLGFAGRGRYTSRG